MLTVASAIPGAGDKVIKNGKLDKMCSRTADKMKFLSPGRDIIMGNQTVCLSYQVLMSEGGSHELRVLL